MLRRLQITRTIRMSVATVLAVCLYVVVAQILGELIRRRWGDSNKRTLTLREKSRAVRLYDFILRKGGEHTLANYTIEAPIGVGGNSLLVFEGHRRTDGLPVALKFTARIENMAEAESEVLKQLAHIPGVAKFVEIVDFGSDIVVLITKRPEFLIDLSAYIRGIGAFTEETAKEVFKEVFRIVTDVYEAGFFHNDLKDQNIIFDLERPSTPIGEVTLIDFGSAIPRNPGKFMSRIGTPSFAPPETLKAEDWTYGENKTAWELGIMLFQMIEGRLPFHSEREVRHLDPPLKKEKAHPEAADLIRRCLQKDPSHRIKLSGIESHKWMSPTMTNSSLNEHNKNRTSSSKPMKTML